MLTIEDELAFGTAGQLETVDKRISRIDRSVAPAALPCVVAPVAFVVRGVIGVPDIDPRHLDGASIVVPIPRIEVHGFRLSKTVRRPAMLRPMVAERFGWSALFEHGHHTRKSDVVLSAVNALRSAPTAYTAFGH